MDARVTALETDMKEVKSSLASLATSSVRIEETLKNLAANMSTKADIATLTARLNALDGTMATKADIATLTAKSAAMEGTMATRADIASIAAKLTAMDGTVAAKADTATVTAHINSIDARLARIERAIEETIKTAVGKAIGPWQLPAILVGTIAALGALATGFGWLMKQPWYPIH